MKQQENNKKIIKFFVIFCAILFLVYNLISSQVISPIYYQVVSNNKRVMINFLEKIKTLPEYQKIFKMNANIYGKSLTNGILEKENQKKQMINNLEQILTYNPKDRDVLYSLYQLYLTEGDKSRAADYLRQAKAVDPSLK